MVKEYFNNKFLAILTKEMKIETTFFTISYLYTESKISNIMASHKMFNFMIEHTKIKINSFVEVLYTLFQPTKPTFVIKNEIASCFFFLNI